MDPSYVNYEFKETRVHLEPPSQALITTIRVPSNVSGSRAQRKLTQDASGEDEVAFRLKNLATASNIYHRRFHHSPKSFLWRVLEDGLLLSIRAVDVCRDDKAGEANLILNFHFTVPARTDCVALVDSQDHNALSLFVLDEANQLYTFNLRPELFRKKSAVDAGLSDLAKVEAPAGLGFKHAHRMVAVSQDLILVTVNDGGMIRLDRNKGENSSQGLWKETFFNVQGWAQNLRSLLPFQGKHAIRYGKVNMEYSAATAVEVTDFGLEDTLCAITVCLDHRMRIWNLADGQILYTSDLLGIDRPPQEIGKWAIDPSQSNLLQITGRASGHRLVTTYSPIGSGEFKFWKIAFKDGRILATDLFSNMSFKPQPPSSSDVWTLADFKLSSASGEEDELWIVWKNNITYRTRRLRLDIDDMDETWRTKWDSVFAETGYETAMTSGPSDPMDVTEKWLQHLQQPGRFTKATLETALAIYERTLGVTKDAGKGRGLAESICAILGSTATLERGPSGEMDYAQLRESSEIQWRRFYRLVIEFDRQRGEALALSVDPEQDMVWVVCSDLLSAVSECSPLEKIHHNMTAPQDWPETALIQAALSFVDSLADSFVQLSNAVLRSEMYEESTKSALERIQHFSDKAGFWRGITEEDCTQVVDLLSPNFSTVTDKLYTELLGQFSVPAEVQGRSPRLPLTDFGRKLITLATRESIDFRWKIAFSQLILLVHMEFEFDNEDDALHHRVDIGEAYRQLIQVLRRLDFLRWLTNNYVSLPVSYEKIPGQTRKAAQDQYVTVLEASVSHLLGFSGKEMMTTGIRDLVSTLCAANSDIELSPALIQCALLKHDRGDLAVELAPFCDQEPFTVYIQGRTLLAVKDFESAAQCFKSAAVGMGTKHAKIDRHSSGLLDDTEWNLINHGQALYYSHIAALYERQRAYFYVTEFARLSLQFFSFEKHAEESKTDVQCRLFNSAVATSQFELAHTTLQHFGNKALRQSSLRKLVEKMCETYHNLELVSLPFPGLQQEVEAILAEKCKNTTDVLGSRYHQILYSWRIKRSNFRGAASVLLDHIQKLKSAGEGDRLTGEDVLDTPVTKQYLLLINALSCVDPKQAWVFDEGLDAHAKRTVVSLADVRKQYQDELDRIAAIQNNQFGFGVDDAMEIV